MSKQSNKVFTSFCVEFFAFAKLGCVCNYKFYDGNQDLVASVVFSFEKLVITPFKKITNRNS